MKHSIMALLAALSLAACAPEPEPERETLCVSILPLRSLVGEIVGDDFRIDVLVPPGASPETFEPTPRQIVALDKARMIFGVGLLDFEVSLLQKIENREKLVILSRGIKLLEGTCAHARHHDTVDGGRAEEDAHNHAHGIDPHIWTSPRELQRMAANAYEAIHAAWPDSTKYTENYRRLSRELQELDRRTAGKIARSGVKAFIIYHPALTYYARDYGIRQEAVETDGKEPSAKRLAELIRIARREGIRQIFYQKQFPASVVETIARDMDARTVAIDPLREEVIANIDSITDLITDVR
ncbi:MAG TPA: zinc ABC transporter substrate-binding protein [Candidatus Alistipes faecigallinarum]|nr:zinc ABC transporter substrate-binding protein [Candidatus Alistipes faecigallinarum]